MPQLQTVEPYSTQPREPTHLESLLSGFSGQLNKNREEARETDALRQIYDQYRQDGSNLEDTLMQIQTKPGISPTTRLNSINQLLNFQKHNASLQKNTKAQLDATEKLEANKRILANLEESRSLPKGSLDAYVHDPKMAEQISRPAKESKEIESTKPIPKDQLESIQRVRNDPKFASASPSKKYQMFIDNGVSRVNAKAEADIFAEENKLKNERASVVGKEQAKSYLAMFHHHVICFHVT